MPDIWIQLENRPWDTMSNIIDRITGKNAQAITGKPSELVSLFSPGTGITKTRRMYAPIRDINGNVLDALIFRHYKAPDAEILRERFKSIRNDLNDSDLILRYDLEQFLLPNEL